MTIADALRGASRQLITAGVENHVGDARRLLRSVLGLRNTTLDVSQELSADQIAQFDQMISQRMARQPVAQIIGSREFWGRQFKVTGDTLDPRPDSELIIELALNTLEPRTILDLGTGTGCLLLTLLSEWPKAEGVGVDISSEALLVARQNATSLQLGQRAEFTQSDWFSDLEGSFDLIVCNPPYISSREMKDLLPEVKCWEPEKALSPGGDGLDSYRTLSNALIDHMNEYGLAIFEIGQAQAIPVSSIFEAAGFSSVEVFTDINDKDRAVVVKKNR